MRTVRKGASRPCLIASPHNLGTAECVVMQVHATFGIILTGQAGTLAGFYIEIHGPTGEEWGGEHTRSIVDALRLANEAAEENGWSILALGLSDLWRESGLSSNTGYGFHPAHPNRAVHMLEPLPNARRA